MNIDIQSQQTQGATAAQITALANHILHRKGQVDFNGTNVSVQCSDTLPADAAGIIVKCAKENGGTINISGATEISDSDWAVIQQQGTCWWMDAFTYKDYIELINGVGSDCDYIELDFMPSSETELIAYIEKYSTNNGNCMPLMAGGSNNRYGIVSNWRFDYGANFNNVGSYLSGNIDIYKGIKANGKTLFTDTDTEFEGTSNLFLFNSTSGSYRTQYAYMGKMKFMQIYEAGTLVLDLYPVVLNKDLTDQEHLGSKVIASQMVKGTVCYYDILHRKIYGNCNSTSTVHFTTE